MFLKRVSKKKYRSDKGKKRPKVYIPKFAVNTYHMVGLPHSVHFGFTTKTRKKVKRVVKRFSFLFK